MHFLLSITLKVLKELESPCFLNIKLLRIHIMYEYVSVRQTSWEQFIVENQIFDLFNSDQHISWEMDI